MAAAKKTELAAHQCEFCKRDFKTERTFLAHICEQKRRWLWRDEKYIRMGFMAYQKFYTLSMRMKKLKTYEDFMSSQYFSSFTKFGRHLLNINAIEADGFVEYLIKGEVKLQDWCETWAYESWVRELSKKEDPYRALTRNMLLMEQWARDTGEEWQEFFRKVEPALATKWIKSGRISPWLLYADQDHQLFNRMSDEQLTIVKEWINPLFWNERMKLFKDDMAIIRQTLKEAGVYQA